MVQCGVAVCCSVLQVIAFPILDNSECVLYARDEQVESVCVRERVGKGRMYGVATVSRIDKIIGLFCKRAL